MSGRGSQKPNHPTGMDGLLQIKAQVQFDQAVTGRSKLFLLIFELDSG
jgi:hypothetical protein